jgi:hypothetical protein
MMTTQELTAGSSPAPRIGLDYSVAVPLLLVHLIGL